MELYNTFDKENHLQPDLENAEFTTLHDWDLAWAVLEPLNIAENDDHEILLAKRFSPGQKALYFFWYLDAQVTNGGFIQFYWNGHHKYSKPILSGLELVGDKNMAELVAAAEEQYLLHQNEFDQQRKQEDWRPLYKNLINFEKLDELYFNTHDKTISLIEHYIREHPDEFVRLTGSNL
jgi:hypothetical protein